MFVTQFHLADIAGFHDDSSFENKRRNFGDRIEKYHEKKRKQLYSCTSPRVQVHYSFWYVPVNECRKVSTQ